MFQRTTRLGALALVPALAFGGLALAPAPAQAAKGPAGAAGWLGGQLDKGLVYNDQYAFNDYGLTADVAIALDAIGGARKQERQIGRALARKVDSWTTGADFGSTDVYAGSVAKAVVLAQAVDAKPRTFGGVDLVKRLNGLVQNTAPIKGRIADQTAGADYANVIGQAFAVQGLAAAGSSKAGSALSFLLKQQCTSGYFRLSFSAAKTGAQSCDAAPKAQKAPDTDVTALTVVALTSLDKKGPKVRKAIRKASRWLVRAQRANGSFGGGRSTTAPNTNSTGLAAWALGETGRCAPAAKAARWVTTLQRKNGAIAYDQAGFDAGKNGIGAAEQDQWRRASAQAAPGLVFLDRRACS